MANQRKGGSLPGSRPNNGGARGEYSPTRQIRKRFPIDWLDVDLDIQQPHQLDAEGLVVGKCSVCRAVWWDDYVIYVRGVIPNATDETETKYPVLAKIERAGLKEKHKSGCPMGDS